MKKLKFEVDVNEANTLLAGLGKLPAEVSMMLILKLQQQAAAQQQKGKANGAA